MCNSALLFSALIARDAVKSGSWSLSKGTPAEVLYKGTITKVIGEDSPSRGEKARDEALPKGHVIYEGKKGHILTYDGEWKLALTGIPLLGLPAGGETSQGGIWGLHALDERPTQGLGSDGELLQMFLAAVA